MKPKNNPHKLLKDTVKIALKHKKTIGYGQANLLFDLLASWAVNEEWEDPECVACKILNGERKISHDIFSVYFDEDNPRCAQLLKTDVEECLEFVLKIPKQRRTLATDIVALVSTEVPELDRMDLIGDAILCSEEDVLEAYSRLLWYALCDGAYKYALTKEQREDRG